MNPHLYRVLAHKIIPEILIWNNIMCMAVHLNAARDCVGRSVVHSSIFTILGAKFGSISVTTGRDLVSVQPKRLSKSKPAPLWTHAYTHTDTHAAYHHTHQQTNEKTVCRYTHLMHTKYIQMFHRFPRSSHTHFILSASVNWGAGSRFCCQGNRLKSNEANRNWVTFTCICGHRWANTHTCSQIHKQKTASNATTQEKHTVKQYITQLNQSGTSCSTKART